MADRPITSYTWEMKYADRCRNQINRKQQREIREIYNKVYRDARRQMEAIPKDGTVSDRIQYEYLNNLRKQLDDAYTAAGQNLEGAIKSHMLEAAQAVVDDTNKWINKAGLAVEGAFSHVPTQIVEMVASGQLYKGNWTLSKAIWKDINKHQSDIERIIAEGIAGNKSAYDIAKDLEKYVNPSAVKPWDWSKVYPGTSKKIDYNAQRLARTMVSHAYQKSMEQVCKDDPFVIGYIWHSVFAAGRTCEICMDRDGEFFKKGELPLDHPNGLCWFEMALSDDMMGISNRLADWVNGEPDRELDKWYKSMRGR